MRPHIISAWCPLLGEQPSLLPPSGTRTCPCWGGSEHLALSLGRCFSRAAEIHWTARVCCSRWSLPAAAASHGGIVVTVRASLGFCSQSHKMWAAVALSDAHTRHKSLTYTLEHTCFMSTGVGSNQVVVAGTSLPRFGSGPGEAGA